MKPTTPFIFVFVCWMCSILTSCHSKQGHPAEPAITASAPSSAPAGTVQTPPGAPDFSGQQMETKIFEVKSDEKGQNSGWGYDILINGKTAIHQPIIPAVAGNKAFSSQEAAKKTADFALQKMKLTGSLPTLSIQELDSLGVLK